MSRKKRRKVVKIAELHHAVGVPDIANRYIMVERVEDLPQPHLPCDKYECSECHAAVWVDKELSPIVKQAKGIHCKHCAARLAGKSVAAVVLDQLNKDLETEL